jgi:2-C-methyl-D-erythritol 4-phosphate cytidylyltransferase
MNNTIIITAGGTGKRMGSDLPKQFLNLVGKPILFHTIEQFYRYDESAQILLTLPEAWKNYWEETCFQHSFSIPHTVLIGGEERFHSIQKALEYATGDCIAVHDGVRPMVSLETIARCFESALKFGSGIPVLPMKESIREITNENNSMSVPRANYRIVQTPQVFKREILVASYQQMFHSQITDDATLVEENNFHVYLVKGNEENIKITTPLDLAMCELILTKNGKHF